MADYATFVKSPRNRGIRFAHVDSPRILKFIQFVQSWSTNNSVYPFRALTEIEGVLRKQWAGLFKRLLITAPQLLRLPEITAKAGDLAEMNRILMRYLESIIRHNVVQNIDPCILNDGGSLYDLAIFGRFASDAEIGQLAKVCTKSLEELYSIIKRVRTFEEYIDECFDDEEKCNAFLYLVRLSPSDDIVSKANEYRRLLFLPVLCVGTDGNK